MGAAESTGKEGGDWLNLTKPMENNQQSEDATGQVALFGISSAVVKNFLYLFCVLTPPGQAPLLDLSDSNARI